MVKSLSAFLIAALAQGNMERFLESEPLITEADAPLAGGAPEAGTTSAPADISSAPDDISSAPEDEEDDQAMMEKKFERGKGVENRHSQQN